MCDIHIIMNGNFSHELFVPGFIGAGMEVGRKEMQIGCNLWQKKEEKLYNIENH